jgi:hypothetical protein
MVIYHLFSNDFVEFIVNLLNYNKCLTHVTKTFLNQTFILKTVTKIKMN